LVGGNFSRDIEEGFKLSLSIYTDESDLCQHSDEIILKNILASPLGIDKFFCILRRDSIFYYQGFTCAKLWVRIFPNSLFKRWDKMQKYLATSQELLRFAI